MATERVGQCSLCGGDVVGWRGAWFAIIPPPPDQCSSCGARRAGEVIEMVPSRGGGKTQHWTDTTDSASVVIGSGGA